MGSIAHACMLENAGILDHSAATRIVSELSRMLAEIEEGALAVEGPDEDVHSWIERTLVSRIGEDGKRLHTARSRNDQTAVALRLYVRERIEDILAGLAGFQRELTNQASDHLTTYLPGYTHLQRGQPVSLAHHLMAHVRSLDDDADRLRFAHRAAGVSPLGAGALAGSSFPINPERCRSLLGLEDSFSNSMHVVGDRDYVLDTAWACAVLLVHLSRWADEVILWCTREFGFVELDDSVAQGSSIMPQKKNPEAAEILRGKSARAIGNVTALLSLLKGVPLTFNSDFQEDKERLFDSLDTAEWSLAAAIPITRGLRYDAAAMARALRGGMVTATELADGLVRRGVPFRDAHSQAGEVVRHAEELGVELWKLDFGKLKELCPEIDRETTEMLLPEAAVAAHGSPGGPAPSRVQEQLRQANSRITDLEAWLEAREQAPVYVAHREGKLLSELRGGP